MARTARQKATKAIRLPANHDIDMQLNQYHKRIIATCFFNAISLSEFRKYFFRGPAIRSTQGTQSLLVRAGQIVWMKAMSNRAFQIMLGKQARIPNSVAPILRRLKRNRAAWYDLVGHFGKRLFHVTGENTTIDTKQSRVNQHPTIFRHDYGKTLQRPEAKAHLVSLTVLATTFPSHCQKACRTSVGPNEPLRRGHRNSRDFGHRLAVSCMPPSKRRHKTGNPSLNH